MPRYTNPQLVSMMETGVLSVLTDIDPFLARARNAQEKVLLLLLFLTGARPSELLEMTSDDIVRERNHLVISIKTKKKGRYRVLYIPLKGSGVFVRYARMLADIVDNSYVPGMRLFFNWSKPFHIRDRVYYLTKKKYPPYFFRHNIMTILAMRGASLKELQYWKGASDSRSVESYAHISRDVQIRIGGLLSRA